eukprot:1161593-Pelagomonas_calceolata.AAC.21
MLHVLLRLSCPRRQAKGPPMFLILSQHPPAVCAFCASIASLSQHPQKRVKCYICCTEAVHAGQCDLLDRHACFST